ncbi:MAG: DUF2207 domain-containing protein [Clostridiales bacterium]|nr:DUF2207 domain-containing protein [Clostridiales bacterium]
MKKFFRSLTAGIAATLLFAYCFFPLYACAASDSNVRTTSYTVDVKVNKDKTFDITERITVDFSEASVGIIREIPAQVKGVFEKSGQATQRDVRVKIKVKDVSGGPYSLFESDTGVAIRTGDPGKYLEGRHEYVIDYRIELYEDDMNGNSSIFLELIPQGWKPDIESARITITFPKDADIQGFGFISIEDGDLVDTDVMTVERLWPDRAGRYTLDATSKRPIGSGEGIAFQATLPDGYFQGGGVSSGSGKPAGGGISSGSGDSAGGGRSLAGRGWFSMNEALFWIVLAAAPLACFLLWVAFGRSGRVEETPECFPPEGLTPAETGLLMHGKLRNSELLSMIFLWANQGCLKIEEAGRRDLMLHKVCALPDKAKPFEKSMFESIFTDGDKVSLRSSAFRIGAGLARAKNLLYAGFGDNIYRNLYDKKSLDMRTLAFVIALLPAIFNFLYALGADPPGSFAGANQADEQKMHEDDGFGDLGAGIFVIIVFGFLFWLIRYYFDAIEKGENPDEKITEMAVRADQSLSRAIHTFSDSVRLPNTVTGALFPPLAVAVPIVLFVCGIYILRTPLPAACTAGSTALCILLANLTRSRTEYYNYMLGRIGGFAAFLKDAEKDRVVSLADGDSTYIYDIMPYVVAMGLTDDWVRRFVWSGVKAKPPEWYCRDDSAAGFFYGAMVKKLAGSILIAEKEIERA